MYQFFFWFLTLILTVICKEIPSALKNDFVTLRNDRNSTDKVSVRVFYECLCPASRYFVIHKVAPTYKELADYMDLELVPFGTGQMDVDKKGVHLFCLHGKLECYGNTLHACAIEILDDLKKSLPYIACMMGTGKYGSDDASAKKCGKDMKIDATPIVECAKSHKGFELLLKYARESLKVPFLYCPYILLNGVEMMNFNLKKNICAALKNPPAACKTTVEGEN